MAELIVEITRFIDDHFPGFVECSFLDAGGRQHVVVGKAPIFTTEALRADSVFPRPGVIGCEIEKEWTDESGRQVLRINTEEPWDVESTEGLSTFTILRSQLSGGA